MEEVDEIKDTVSLLSLAYLLALTFPFNSLAWLVEEVDEIKDTVSLLLQLSFRNSVLSLTSLFNSLDRLVEEVDDMCPLKILC